MANSPLGLIAATSERSRREVHWQGGAVECCCINKPLNGGQVYSWSLIDSSCTKDLHQETGDAIKSVPKENNIFFPLVHLYVTMHPSCPFRGELIRGKPTLRRKEEEEPTCQSSQTRADEVERTGRLRKGGVAPLLKWQGGRGPREKWVRFPDSCHCVLLMQPACIHQPWKGGAGVKHGLVTVWLAKEFRDASHD